MSDLKFRSSIWSTFQGAILLNSCFFIPILLFVWWIDSLENLKYSVFWVSTIIYSVLIAFSIVVSIYYTYTLPIKVNSIGIYGYNLTGNGSFVAWKEIEKIEPYRYFGYRYLRLFFPTLQFLYGYLCV